MTADNNSQQGDLYSYDSFAQQRKPSDTKFLWWCAGAHQPLLKQHPSEQTKYAGLGGVLLATFLLAALSGGYALYTVFGNWWMAIGFGLLWGLKKGKPAVIPAGTKFSVYTDKDSTIKVKE